MEIKKIENSQTKFTFTVKKDEFEKALDKAFENANKDITYPGFRKGKGTRAMYEKNYGIERLFPDALDIILNEKVNEIVKDEKNKDLLNTFVGRFEPLLDEKIERGKDFKASLVIDTYPEVTLPQYKGVEVLAKDTKVTAEEVDAEIDNLVRKDIKKVLKKKQVIAKNDFATFDFVGSVDGKEFDGGKADNYELQIGSGQFIPGFEDQMIGMKADEEKIVKVTFPKDYGAENLAGKDAEFKVKVHEIKVEEKPELNDEYVKTLKIEGVNTLDELKANRKKIVADRKEAQEKDRITNDVINAILDSAKVDLPKSMIEERANAFKSQYENQAKMYNIPFEKFVTFMGMDVEAFNKRANEEGRKQALFQVVASEIINVEKLAPKKEDLEAKAEADAKTNGKTKEQNLQENYYKYYNDIAYANLINLLVSNAKEVKELSKKEAKEEKPAAKKATTTKSTAKKTTTAKATAEKKPAAKKTTAAKATEEKKPAAKKTTTAKKTTKKAE